MPGLTIRMFGKFSVQRNDKPVPGLDACKLQELFAYLLIRRNAPQPRETLAALLWGDVPTGQSKKCLRQALWQLQTALDSHGRKGRFRTLCVEPDEARINPLADVWLDVAVFEQAFSLTREISGEHFERAQANILDEAVQLYRGDLLEGCYQDWCLCERERLQSSYLAMLNKLMSYCEAQHRYETGLTYGLRVLRYDRARESTHRRLMRLYYLAGDRTAALRQYQQCATALKEELGVKPAQRTVKLYEQIQMDQVDDPTLQLFDSAMPRIPVTATSPELLTRLRQLGQLLSDLQRSVQHDIKAVEAILKSER
jgi:DNA-binding SARP family transcriptional activator